MNGAGVLIITSADVARVMQLGDWLDAADTAFRATASGKASSPPPLHLPMSGGGFHAKGASLALDREFVAVKVNGNFPGNPRAFGLPTVQGVMILADGGNGVPLAIMDSTLITLWRTAAASALAARLLALPASETLLVCGSGEQGRAHATVLREVLPLTRILLWDRDPAAARSLAQAVGGTAVDNLGAAAVTAEVIACCTPACAPYLDTGMVRPGCFIAAVGADNPDKSEIAPSLMAAAAVVTDSLRQCAAMGDLHHAVAAGAMSEADVRAELADVLAATAPGRCTDDEIIIFDSTGMGVQDVTAAALVYRRCVELGLGVPISLAGH